MVSGYNRRATVSNSDFAYIGGNAVAAWGCVAVLRYSVVGRNSSFISMCLNVDTPMRRKASTSLSLVSTAPTGTIRSTRRLPAAQAAKSDCTRSSPRSSFKQRRLCPASKEMCSSMDPALVSTQTTGAYRIVFELKELGGIASFAQIVAQTYIATKPGMLRQQLRRR